MTNNVSLHFVQLNGLSSNMLENLYYSEKSSLTICTYNCGEAVTSVVDTPSISGTFQFTACPRVAGVTHTGGTVHLTVDARLGAVLTHPTLQTNTQYNHIIYRTMAVTLNYEYLALYFTYQT